MTDHDTATDRYAHLEREATYSLTNMVKALNMLPWLNTPDDIARRDAATRILKARRAAARRTGK